MVTVIETPRGPVALTPTELAMHTADLDILRASSEIEEWAAAQEVFLQLPGQPVLVALPFLIVSWSRS